jgi:DNA-binding NarL/FixJ family response regulator
MTQLAPVIASSSKQSEVQDAQPTPPLRVLQIEDNPADALLTQEHIRGTFWDVKFDSAVCLADVTPERAANADCALLDLSLPDASGVEAVIALRGMSESLPIIVLTGFDDLEWGLAAVGYGADDYLIKNHADGYTLERALRYSIERRRMMLEVIRSATVATIATADTIAADAALAASIASTVTQGGTTSTSESAVGNHEVAVRIDPETGDYALNCRSCSWQSDGGTDDRHSWAARSLDSVLLQHVAFGGLEGEAAALLAQKALAEARKSAKAGSDSSNTRMSRRMVLKKRSWH